MDALEKRILQVSKMIADYNVEAILSFPAALEKEFQLDPAIEILRPELKLPRALLSEITCKCDEENQAEPGETVADDLLNHYESALIETVYTVGIIAGIHLAGRAEIIPELAKAYAETTSPNGRDFTRYSKAVDHLIEKRHA